MKTLAIVLTCWACVACVTQNTIAIECNDGVRNGNETGVDCGGGACVPCASNLPCKVNRDCGSSLCDAGLCQPLPTPGIASFMAAKPTLTVGGSTTLTAVFSNGNATIAPGIGAVASNQPVSVGPFNSAGSTTYTLSVDDGTGVTMEQTLTVAAVPVSTISSFAANANRIAAGQSVQLTSVFSDGNGTIAPGIGAVQSGVAVSSGALLQDSSFYSDGHQCRRRCGEP